MVADCTRSHRGHCIPCLTHGVFHGKQSRCALLGPPAIWSRPWEVPPRSELVGNYTEFKRQLDNNTPPASASLTLQPDGSMIVANLPADFGTASCILSGKGAGAVPMKTEFVSRSFPRNRPGLASPVPMPGSSWQDIPVHTVCTGSLETLIQAPASGFTGAHVEVLCLPAILVLTEFPTQARLFWQ